MATGASLTLSDDDRSSSQASENEHSLDLAGHNPTRDTLGEGIVSILSPTLRTLDEGVLATKRSQEELSEQIALLTDQLKLISAEKVDCPIDLDGYVERLGTIKGKINVISSVLHSAQERLNKVHEQAVREATRRKPLIESCPISSSAIPSISTSEFEGDSKSTASGQSQNLKEEVSDKENTNETKPEGN